jgi:hypothetical protein
VGRAPRVEDGARRVLSAGLSAIAFRPLAEQLELSGPSVTASLLMFTLVLTVWTVDALLAAVLRAERLHTRLRVAAADEMRAQFASGMAIGSSGVLIALSCTVTGLAGLLVFSAPLLVAQVAFRRHAEVRRTYLETVRALSRVTEVGGYVENGHSRRVSQISHGIACELGLAEAELLELEYAALSRAAQASLRLLSLDPGVERRRVVLAAEVSTDDVFADPDRTLSVEALGEVRLAAPVPLAKAVAAHMDAAEAESDIAAATDALGAADQGDEDARFLVDGAADHELLWYAVQEIEHLL